MPDQDAALRERATDMVRFLAPARSGPRADYVGWTERLRDPDEPFIPRSSRRYSCHDELAQPHAVVEQGELLPGWPGD